MAISGFFATLINLPYYATIPIAVFLLSLAVRQPWKKSLQGGIKVAMGGLAMWGISYAAIKYFAPAVLAMSHHLGFPLGKLNLVDVGWTNALFALVSPMMWVNILLFSAINVGLILINATRTLYVDFPCMWRGAWTGLIIWGVTNSFWWGTAGMIIFLLSDIFLADLNAERMRSFHNFAAKASFPNSQNAFIIGAPLAWVMDRIPVVKDWKWDARSKAAAAGPKPVALGSGVAAPAVAAVSGAGAIDSKWIKDRFGFWAEPMVLGMIAGAILGLLAGYNVLDALGVGVVAALMLHFWPVALGLLFDGWGVFNEGLRNILVKFFKGKKEIYVALDTSVLLGHPSVTVSTILMYPIAFFLSIVVPGIGLLPVISMQIIQWWMAHITGWTRGKIIHNLIICSVLVILYGWVATAMAGPYTFWAQQFHLIPAELANAGVQVTNWDGGGDLRIFVLYKLFSLFK